LNSQSFLAILFAYSLCLTPVQSLADQTNPQLEELFTRLKIVEEAEQARFIEGSIWNLWMQHDNADVEQLLAIGTRRMNGGQYPEAMLVFNELLGAYPEFAEAWNKRATLYYLLGDFDASLSDIDATLELEPRHFGAISGQGLIYMQQEKLSEARASFEHLLTIHPNSPSAQNNLDMILAEIQRSTI